MFLWELIAYRLRSDGWVVWEKELVDREGRSYTVHLHRPGMAWQTTGPTLTEAYAEAARRARQVHTPTHTEAGPHFGLKTVAV